MAFEPTPLRLLSLGMLITTLIMVIFMLTFPCQDGGGVRGYTSLLILKEIFKAVEAEAGRKVMPCELFDLIGGTSTGG